jgi:hypothetical protein
MPWTSKQKQIAVQACRAAGITEDQRRDLILRNFANAHHQGDITSTAPKLTSNDFEAFMAIVERYAGGKVMHFTTGFWSVQAADRLKRMRHKAIDLAALLESHGKLAAGGVGLAGWISKRVSAGTASRVEELEYHGLAALIIGLEAYARQNGICTDKQGATNVQPA